LKTQPIRPARIDFDADGIPQAPDFGDRYHPRAGAAVQARHVFLSGNSLPQRWQQRHRFVILETGFGLGNNFLATWQAWRDDPARCERLVYVSIEAHPPGRDDLARLHQGSPWPEAVAELLAAWPPLTPNLHGLDFEGGRVHLLLALGDVRTLLPELTLQADAFYLDGFAPARNPAMWESRVLKALGRRAAPGATAATWSVAREVREGLRTAGFEVELAPGVGGKREITLARYAPRFAAPVRIQRAPGKALVIGAGLAGAFAARALAEEGWQVLVFDRQARPAAGSSGNAGGLMHGTVHADDGPHARLLRSAAQWAAHALRPWPASVPGSLQGLLRLGGDLAAMRALIAQQQLPADWVGALDTSAASALAGVPLTGPAWLYPGAGWVSPAALVAWALDHPRVRFVGGVDVREVRRSANGLWQAANESADVVLVANAGDARRLLEPHGLQLPLSLSRGQVTRFAAERHGLRMPLAGDGYALPLDDGQILCGATQHEGDLEPDLREVDHRQNLERLRRLCGLQASDDPNAWQGRVGWRVTTDDRLPVAGPVPCPDHSGRQDQARLWPRIEGLFVCTALGGRGITWAPLLGRLLAAQMGGAPLPLEQGLVDAIDPVRWRVRAARAMSQG
jgi:tRNA 5-methylaminomethyl-2-thiouridine biosynthesis bifunctional protein